MQKYIRKLRWGSQISLISFLSIGIAYSSEVQEFFKKVPHGLPEAQSPFFEIERSGFIAETLQQEYRQLLHRVKDKIYGVQFLGKKDQVRVLEAIYLLEHQVISILQDFYSHRGERLSQIEKDQLVSETLDLYRTLRFQAQFYFEFVIREIDVALPGATGLRIETVDPTGKKYLYYPNYRSDRFLSRSEQRIALEKKKKQFLDKGGNLDEIFTLDEKALRGFPTFSQLEYVMLESGEIRVTFGKSGHLLLADGKAVRSAGQLVILQSSPGEPDLVIISNASGSYKPRSFAVKDSFSSENSLFSKTPKVFVEGEPLSLQTYKIWMKVRGIDKAVSKQQARALQSQAERILKDPFLGFPRPKARELSKSCSDLLAS